MTRFARAHGSKASNERQPEEATSWNILKQQMLKKQSASKDNVEAASKPIRQPFVSQKSEIMPTEWAEFEETPDPKHKKPAKKKSKLGVSAEKVFERLSLDEQHSSKSKLHKIKKSIIGNEKKLEKKLKKIKDQQVQTQHCKDLDDLDQVLTETKPQVTVSKRKKRKNKLKVLEESFNPGSTDTQTESKSSKLVDVTERQLSRRQLKRKRNKLKKELDNGFVFKHPPKKYNNKELKCLQVEPLENANAEEGEPQLKNQRMAAYSNTPIKVAVETTDQMQSHSEWQVQSKRQKRNLKRLGDPTEVEEHKRNKPYIQPQRMVINGQEIEVTLFDRYPILKRDADRLEELRKQMVDNGIPPEDIYKSIKLERRKAEKAFNREKRKVCFHCRKGGHNLSDCPELTKGSNQDAAGTGICFKCGSTEHTHFECRVVRGQEFRFAKCFICSEQGHISRQCPDNPRGLYPKGGGCKVCGDVTHLKKDCPDLHEKKEQNVITLATAQSDKLEALDEDLRMEDNGPAVKKAPKKKIVTF